MLREDLKTALKTAMLAKDTTTVGAVRLIIAGMKDKDVDARGKGKVEASEDDILALMQNMIKQRKESFKIYMDAGRPELADNEQSEMTVIEKFLPKQMDATEVENAIKEAISATEANSIKDMGKVMAELKAKYVGQMDFGKASVKIKELLGQ